ncbi:MAG: SufS family cysteine desulfurase [Planctomycetaceae bacterium]|nr:SufS family cysteine desulfurase [Planctomycetaceae bacterium]
MVERVLSFAASRAGGTQKASSTETAARGKSAEVVIRAGDPGSPVENHTPFDVEEIRSQFPVLMRPLPGGLTSAYLDSGASAQKPVCVIEKEREVEEQYFANAYRGRYAFGARIDDELEASRSRIASFLNAPSSQQVAFTAGTTIALNMIAFGWGRRHVKAGDEILISLMEHHANFVPWQQLALQTGATLRFIPLTDDGQFDLTQLDSVLTPRTKIVAVCGMSNMLGTVNPIGVLTEKAHAVGARIVVDAAQSVPHLPTDVQSAPVDFLVFSGHKLYGPTGVGVLYGSREALEETDPVLFGGHMISRVFRDRSEWAEPPARFEPGTLPIVQAIALGEAIRWVQDVGLNQIHKHEQVLLASAWEKLLEVDGLTIFGPPLRERGGIISFRIEGVHPEDLAAILDQHAVFTRHGHHCTMPLHDHLGVTATTRASLAAYNTLDDVERLVSAVKDAIKKLRR